MTIQLTTTLKRIRDHGPCENGWKTLLAGLGKRKADDEPLPFATILRISGLDFALWCARAEPQHERVWRLFAVWCVRQVQHLLTDQRSLVALDVSERYANGMATDTELRAARDNARVASWNAASRRAASAESAAWYAAWVDGWEVVWEAPLAAEIAAGSKRYNRGARDAALAAQTEEFLRIVGGE